MPVSTIRACPHCDSEFASQRKDNIFCSRLCLHKFNYWRRSRRNNAPRSPKLVAEYTLARQQLRLAELKLQVLERQLERRRAALEAQVQ